MGLHRQTVNIKKDFFELEAWNSQQLIIGIDEVGRGCFAGPVVAAAVILPINKKPRMLKDSKEMTSQEREAAFLWIQKNCLYGIGVIHHRFIDEYNIVQATKAAMIKATLNVLQITPKRPSAIIIDAMPLDLCQTAFHDIAVHSFIKGESKSSSIAAASITAKVVRDRMMNTLDPLVPGYGWSSNKGYGTSFHRNIIQTQEHSILHRQKFLQKLWQQRVNEDEQLPLFFDETEAKTLNG